MNTDLMFSTGKDDWATPPEVFDPLNREFRFTVDGAANSTNHKCSHWWGPDHPLVGCRDALAMDWRAERVWVNPPYSRGLQAQFIKKAWDEAHMGATVVMLLPARTDTRAFHEYIYDAKHCDIRIFVREVRFLKGRIKFVGAPASAPFPSMVVVFGR
jgi:phage N-6-adenine-methyltransferase